MVSQAMRAHTARAAQMAHGDDGARDQHKEARGHFGKGESAEGQARGEHRDWADPVQKFPQRPRREGEEKRGRDIGGDEAAVGQHCGTEGKQAQRNEAARRAPDPARDAENRRPERDPEQGHGRARPKEERRKIVVRPVDFGKAHLGKKQRNGSPARRQRAVFGIDAVIARAPRGVTRAQMDGLVKRRRLMLDGRDGHGPVEGEQEDREGVLDLGGNLEPGLTDWHRRLSE